MKISCQNPLAGPGTLLEQFKFLKNCGFEGVEVVSLDRLEDCACKKILSLEKEIVAASEKSGLPVTSICGGLHFDFLDQDKTKRDADVERLKSILHLAGRLKATGPVMVPIFNRTPRFPDLSPWKTSVELQKELLLVQLKEVAKVAEDAGSQVILEPLNRYEAPWLNRLEQGAELCERVGSKGLGFMADFFHMNIEETDPVGAIRKYGKWINHVHLADNTRQQPGTGATNFKANFEALKEIKFKGAMALECGVAGPDRAKALKTCVEFLKKLRG